MARLGEIYAGATRPGVPKRALWTSVIVGTILNAINQGDVAVCMARGAIDHAAVAPACGVLVGWKIILTFIVPYCVFTFGAVASHLATK